MQLFLHINIENKVKSRPEAGFEKPVKWRPCWGLQQKIKNT